MFCLSKALRCEDSPVLIYKVFNIIQTPQPQSSLTLELKRKRSIKRRQFQLGKLCSVKHNCRASKYILPNSHENLEFIFERGLNHHLISPYNNKYFTVRQENTENHELYQLALPFLF